MENQLVFKENPWCVNSMMIFLGAVVIINTYHALGWNRETIAFCVGLIFFILPIHTWKITQTVFDIDSHKISWYRSSIFGQKKEFLEFSDVQQVVLHSISGSQRRSYCVILKTKLGNIPLSLWYGHKKGAQEKKTKIENILAGKHYDDNADNKNVDHEIKALLESGRKIDAITQLRESQNMTLTQAKKYIDNFKK